MYIIILISKKVALQLFLPNKDKQFTYSSTNIFRSNREPYQGVKKYIFKQN